MEKFEIYESRVAYLEIMNVDTDMIIPKEFLKTTEKTGLGVHLFHEMRYDNDDNEVESFILNQDKYRNSGVLVSLDNFGCGSSREHAPWSIVDYGIRVVIAPSFADIFFNNCFKNSILPIVLPKDIVLDIIQYSKDEDNPIIKVDLFQQKIFLLSINEEISFEIEFSRKESLLLGLDEIGETLKYEEKITEFENNYKSELPWLFSIKRRND